MAYTRNCPAYVYEITNQKDGTVYVGKARDPESRWRGHVNLALHPLYAAMRSCGVDAFTFNVVQQCASEKEALAAEARRIRDFEEEGRPLYNVVRPSTPASSEACAGSNTTRETLKGRWNGRLYWCDSKRAWVGKVFDSGSFSWRNKAVPVTELSEEGALVWFDAWFASTY